MALPPLTPPTPNPLTAQEISDNLKTLYGADARISKYAPFFFLFKLNLDGFTGLSGYALRYSNQDITSNTYSAFGGPTLYMHAISALELKAPQVFSGGDVIYQAYIALDRKTIQDPTAKLLVPYQVAKALSSAFMYGLTTRMLLEKYKAVWQNAATPVYLTYPLVLNAAPPPTGPIPNPVPAFNANDWCDSYVGGLVSKFTNPASFAAPNYAACIAALTDSSLQVAGMAMGWVVGDALADSTIANVGACQAAVRALLNDTFTTEQIGIMAGYTLSYLSGYVSSERTATMITGGDPGPPQTNATSIYADLSNFTQKIGQSTNIDNNVVGIANSLFAFALQDFYGAADVPAKAAKNWYFLKGYEEGLTLGADVMYRSIFNEAFQLGFTVGFREGFTQGYSAGYATGYSAGYQVGKSQSTWMSGLANTFSALGQLLNSPQTATLLKDVNTVGTVIAAFF